MTASLKINLIGSGNLAWNLAERLSHSQHNVIAVYGRKPEKTKAVAALNRSQVVTSLNNLPHDADLSLVCLADSAIMEVAPQLHFLKGLIAHSAGSLPLSVLDQTGKRTGVLYPLQTFTFGVKADWDNVWVCIESKQPDDLLLLQEVAQCLSSETRIINSEQRQSLHLAAIFTANFNTYLQSIAENLLLDSNMTFDAMLPLFKGVYAKIAEIGPREAITGPAARGDMATINKHLSLLASHPDYQRLYQILTSMIMDQVTNKKSKQSD